LEFALSIHLVTGSNSLAAFNHNETFSRVPMAVECTCKREVFMNKRSIRARLKLLGPRMIITLVVAGIAAVALIFPAKFAGFAVTMALKKESNDDPNALKGILTAIDSGNADSVYVMSVEDGVDIAGMGGWMGTAMRARNFSGAVIAGGVRDVAYLNEIGFLVYPLGIVPSTSIRHYRFASANTTVHCDGVEVNAGDIVVADAGGVVVPRGVAGDVLAVAEKMDFNEHSMYAYIEKLKSITEAVKKFGRL
jgi:regulator of RNase E activity RraA